MMSPTIVIMEIVYLILRTRAGANTVALENNGGSRTTASIKIRLIVGTHVRDVWQVISLMAQTAYIAKMSRALQIVS
jgi:hypothetical protein